MAKSSSSRRWLQEHFSDPYVKQAQKAGYRGRAAYKLLQLQHKYQLFEPGMTVIDLGAAPGGWSQVAAEAVGDRGTVLAVDILAMEPIPGVDMIQGDFHEEQTLQRLLDQLGEQQVDWVVSDMAPNLTGNKTTDQARSEHLVELAVALAEQILPPGGSLLAKVFQGPAFQELLRQLRQDYHSVSIHKPDASRNRSAETYVMARYRKQG